MKEFCMRDIVYDNKVARDQFDPLSPNTLKLEARLVAAEIYSGGRISGADAMPTSTLPINTGVISLRGQEIIVAPEKGNIVVFGQSRGNADTDRLVKRLGKI